MRRKDGIFVGRYGQVALDVLSNTHEAHSNVDSSILEYSDRKDYITNMTNVAPTRTMRTPTPMFRH